MPDGGTADARSVDTPVDAPVPMITFVRSASIASAPFSTGNANMLSLPLLGAVGQGNLLAVFVSYSDSAHLTSVTDDLGNLFMVERTLDDVANTQSVAIAYGTAISGGTDTIYANFDNSICCRILVVHELHGANLTTPFDNYAIRYQTGNDAGMDGVTSSAATTTTSPEYIFAVSTNADGTNGETITAGTGFTPRELLTPSGGNTTLSEDRQASPAGPVTSTFTYSMSGAAMTAEMAFKP
jgi:hypothetical protein